MGKSEGACLGGNAGTVAHRPLDKFAPHYNEVAEDTAMVRKKSDFSRHLSELNFI
jgi:hypothetical protein